MIRFLKDDGTSYPEWRKIKVSELIEEYSEKVKGTSELPVLTSSTKGIKYQAEHFSKEQNHNIDGYNIIPKGYCTYRNRSDTDRFFFNTNTICDQGIVSKFYPVFKIVGCLSDFLIVYLNSSRETKRVISYTAVGTSQNVLSFNDFKNIIVKIPCEEEQQKIVDFLLSVDEIISVSEKEIINLEEQRKSVVQKIFSREVRFKKDDGSDFSEWEEKNFGELAEYKKGPFGSALKKEIFVPKSETTVKVYEQQNAIEKKDSLERYFITEEYFKKMKSFEVKAGDIIVSCAGTIGEIYVLPANSERGVINQALMRVRVNKYVVNQIYFTLIFDRMLSTEGKKISNGSALKNIPPFADLKKQKVLLPCLEEQKKIAEFLSEFDTAIEYAKQEIVYWKELKKGLLQQMFM